MDCLQGEGKVRFWVGVLTVEIKSYQEDRIAEVPMSNCYLLSNSGPLFWVLELSIGWVLLYPFLFSLTTIVMDFC